MNRNYIGIANTFHDSAIAIVDSSGEVVFAEATERFIQYKRAMNVVPDLYVRTGDLIREYCENGTELVPAFSWSAQVKQIGSANLDEVSRLKEKLIGQFGSLPEHIGKQIAGMSFLAASQLHFLTQPGIGLSFEVSRNGGGKYRLGTARHYNHHLTHAATACFTSPFDEAVCAVIDGFGEDRAFDCYVYRNGELKELEIPARANHASLGFFYIDVCEACGFSSFSGEEWKVMGLAAYGKLDEEIYELLRGMLSVNGLSIESPTGFRLQKMQHKLGQLSRKKDEPSIAAANIAYAGQKVFTEVLMEYLNNLHETGLSSNLVLGGGCALNSSANGQILEQTSFKDLHVFSAPADDGNAIGAALLAFQEDHRDCAPRRTHLLPYLGSKMSRETLENVKAFSRIPKLVESRNEAPERAAEMLAQGKIIGWIQGRAEFGPRALGNRSILADPRSPDIKEAINSRVKFREEFRPFAPSILHECGPRYFENYQESPYMERTLRFRQEVVSLIPGVVHHDGTGRLQTVKQEWNERYYRLIHRFWKLTDIPLVLNTSFNVMGKPISHSVEDVLAVFFTSGLDAVFIDEILIEK